MLYSLTVKHEHYTAMKITGNKWNCHGNSLHFIKIYVKIIETLPKFCEKFNKLKKLLMKFLKNLYGMLGKILFAKFSGKIMLKVSRVKSVKKILRKFWI